MTFEIGVGSDIHAEVDPLPTLRVFEDQCRAFHDRELFSTFLDLVGRDPTPSLQREHLLYKVHSRVGWRGPQRPACREIQGPFGIPEVQHEDPRCPDETETSDSLRHFGIPDARAEISARYRFRPVGLLAQPWPALTVSPVPIACLVLYASRRSAVQPSVLLRQILEGDRGH